MKTEIWVPSLISGAVALVGAFGGISLTNRSALRRENRAWARERRQAVYFDFLQAVRTLQRARFEAHADGDTDASDEAMDALYRLRTGLRLFGTAKASDAAEAVYRDASEKQVDHRQVDPGLVEAFERRARKDLSVSD